MRDRLPAAAVDMRAGLLNHSGAADAPAQPAGVARS